MTVKGLVLLGSVAVVAAQRPTCGNCFFNDGTDGTNGYVRCNSGESDRIPYGYDQFTQTGGQDIPASIQRSFDENGINTATPMTVNEMRTMVNAGVKNSWKTMFCSSYLDRYKDSNVTEVSPNGAACVREPTREAIIRADNEARELYYSLGTSNGYASSFAVSKGEPYPPALQKWGTGGEGDVPANWCGVYMRYLLCGVAFPQIAMTNADLTRVRQASLTRIAALSTTFARPNYSVPILDGTDIFLRAIEVDTCEETFNVCNRRQPTDDEVKSDFVHPSIDNARFRFFGPREAEQEELNSDWLCKSWQDGYGLSQAGRGVSDEGEPILLEAAGGLVPTLAAVIALCLFALL